MSAHNGLRTLLLVVMVFAVAQATQASPGTTPPASTGVPPGEPSLGDIIFGISLIVFGGGFVIFKIAQWISRLRRKGSKAGSVLLRKVIGVLSAGIGGGVSFVVLHRLGVPLYRLPDFQRIGAETDLVDVVVSGAATGLMLKFLPALAKSKKEGATSRSIQPEAANMAPSCDIPVDGQCPNAEDAHGCRTAACPFCGVNIDVKQIVEGTNHCPACGKTFKVAFE